jgi:hypothetical protein
MGLTLYMFLEKHSVVISAENTYNSGYCREVLGNAFLLQGKKILRDSG